MSPPEPAKPVPPVPPWPDEPVGVGTSTPVVHAVYVTPRTPSTSPSGMLITEFILFILISNFNLGLRRPTPRAPGSTCPSNIKIGAASRKFVTFIQFTHAVVGSHQFDGIAPEQPVLLRRGRRAPRIQAHHDVTGHVKRRGKNKATCRPRRREPLVVHA
jgi:hypothetical protein